MKNDTNAEKQVNEIPTPNSDFFSKNKSLTTNFNVYLCGEKHDEASFKDTLIMHTTYTPNIDFHLLVEGLFYHEEINSRAQGIEYAPAKWLGIFLNLYSTVINLKSILFTSPADNNIFTWDDEKFRSAAAHFLSKMRFFFRTHDDKKEYSYDFLQKLAQNNPELYLIANHYITKWKLSSTTPFKDVEPSWLYKKDLEDFKNNLIPLLQITALIMSYLFNDQRLSEFLQSQINGLAHATLLTKCINEIHEIPPEYTTEYYTSQVETGKLAFSLACQMRETFIVGNLKHFIQEKNPCKNVILILGDAHIQNIEANFKDFLGDSLIVEKSTYSFVYWPLSRKEKEGDPPIKISLGSACDPIDSGFVPAM